MRGKTSHREDPECDASPEALRAALAQARSELQVCRHRADFCTSALRAIGDGVVTIDLQGRIVSMNPVASHLTGWRESETSGRLVSEIVRFADPQGNSVDVLSPTITICSLRRRDSHVVLVEGTVTPLLDAQERKLGSVVIFRNVTAARRMTNELKYHANHDSLTGLDNRRSFESRLRRAVANADEQQCRHALICIDLDRFKSVNDAAGHVAGDELLRRLAVLLRRQLRDHDTVARLGGDEFAILLEDCTFEHALHVAEKIRVAVAAFSFDWQGHAFRVGASLGLVTFNDGAASASELLKRADETCYRAKDHGRDQVAVYAEQQGRDARLSRTAPQRAQLSGGNG
jgi:diguanylate cyclase (GGDEF)-like protein/PAS domain S-box-containing protein